MSEKEDLKAILETLRSQDGRIDSLSKSHERVIEKQEKIEIQVFELKGEVQLMVAEVRRLSEMIEHGNGMPSRLMRLETLSLNNSEDLHECQKRSATNLHECQKRSAMRWKYLIGAFTTLAVSSAVALLVYLLTKNKPG